MRIREKIESRKSERENEDNFNKALRTMLIRIMWGYVGGTVIGLILRRFIYG